MKYAITALACISREQYLEELGGGCYDLVSYPRPLRDAKLHEFHERMKQGYREGGWEISPTEGVEAGQMVLWLVRIEGLDSMVRVLGWVYQAGPNLRIKPHFLHRVDMEEAELSGSPEPGPSLRLELQLQPGF
jgi:hypothetical protein